MDRSFYIVIQITYAKLDYLEPTTSLNLISIKYLKSLVYRRGEFLRREEAGWGFIQITYTLKSASGTIATVNNKYILR